MPKKQKSKKGNKVPNWMKSKYFLLGVALFIALGVIIGFQTFAGGAGYYIPPVCMQKNYKLGDKSVCIAYAKKALNWTCGKERQSALVISNYFNKETFKKVYGFQSGVGITPDGKIGKNTWANLYHRNRKDPQHPKNSTSCYYPN